MVKADKNARSEEQDSWHNQHEDITQIQKSLVLGGPCLPGPQGHHTWSPHNRHLACFFALGLIWKHCLSKSPVSVETSCPDIVWKHLNSKWKENNFPVCVDTLVVVQDQFWSPRWILCTIQATTVHRACPGICQQDNKGGNVDLTSFHIQGNNKYWPLIKSNWDLADHYYDRVSCFVVLSCISDHNSWT